MNRLRPNQICATAIVMGLAIFSPIPETAEPFEFMRIGDEDGFGFANTDGLVRATAAPHNLPATPTVTVSLAKTNSYRTSTETAVLLGRALIISTIGRRRKVPTPRSNVSAAKPSVKPPPARSGPTSPSPYLPPMNPGPTKTAPSYPTTLNFISNSPSTPTTLFPAREYSSISYSATTILIPH